MPSSSRDASFAGRSQYRTTSPSSIDTISIRSSRSGSARNAGSSPPRETISSNARLALIRRRPVRALRRPARGRASPSNTRAPIWIAGSERTPAAARAGSTPRSSASATERSSIPLSTAVGCISHAAAAISTVSRSPRSRPPANAWRNAASENATARPTRFAYAAVQHRRRGCPAASVPASAAAGARARQRAALIASSVRRSGPRPRASVRGPAPTPGRPAARHDLLGDEVARRAAEVVVEDWLRWWSWWLAGHCDQPWISQPSAARAASITASDSVG